MTTIGDVVSRVRNQIKAEIQDAFVTDRYLYSLIEKSAQLLMRRQDSANKLKKFNSVWKTLPFVELEEVDKVEACCTGIQSGMMIKRTRLKLPTFIELQPTQPGTYTSMTKTTSFKYNKTKYFWFIDGHLYFPTIEWDAVKIEGIFQEDVSLWLCNDEDKCVPRYRQECNIPEFLFAEIETQVLQQLMASINVPAEDSDNKQNINR